MTWEDVADLDHETPVPVETACWAEKNGRGCGTSTTHPSGLCPTCLARLR